MNRLDWNLNRLMLLFVVSFLNHLETARSNGASSRNVRLAAIKSFMRFMEYRAPSALEQIRRILAIPMKKTDTRLVRHLSTKEVQALLDAPIPTHWAGIRDRAMLHLCFAAGLRVSELTAFASQIYPCIPRPASGARQRSPGTLLAAMETHGGRPTCMAGCAGFSSRTGTVP